MRLSVICFICYNAIAGTPTERFLRKKWEVLERNLPTLMQEYDRAIEETLRSDLDSIVSTFIGSERSARELFLLSHVLHSSTEPREGDDFTTLLVDGFLKLPDSREKMSVFNPSSSVSGRVLKLSKRVGISAAEALGAFHGSDLPRRLDFLEEELSSVSPSTFRTFAGLPTLESERLLVIEHLLEDCLELRLYLLRTHIKYLSNHILHAVDNRIARVLSLVIDAAEIAVMIPDDVLVDFRSNVSILGESITAIAHALRERYAPIEQLGDELAARLGPIVEEFEALGGSEMLTREQILMEKVKSVSNEARILIVPRMQSIITRAYVFHSEPRNMELFETVMDELIPLLNDPQSRVSLVSVASFLKSDYFQAKLKELLVARDRFYEGYVLRIAFDLARLFGVRMLADHPDRLLPHWSSLKISTCRRLIATFLHFEGPSEWDEYQIYRIIPNGTEQQLARAVTVLTSLYRHRSFLIEKSPLIIPGQWLQEFISSAPTPFAVWVHDLFLPRVYPTEILKKLFSGVQNVVDGYFHLPKRFVSMWERINAIAERYTGILPQKIITGLLVLPATLMRNECNAGLLYDADENAVLVEEAVLTFFNLLELEGEKTANASGEVDLDQHYQDLLQVVSSVATNPTGSGGFAKNFVESCAGFTARNATVLLTQSEEACDS